MKTMGWLIGMLLLTVAVAADEGLEARAHKLDVKIMAPCCWTQPVSDHYSGVANEIRREIRKMLLVGKTDQEILDFYVEKYGERILSMPRAEGFNLLAYVLPSPALLMGGWVVWVVLKYWGSKRRVLAPQAAPAGEIDRDYAARLERELQDRE